ncbi:hypothetical protein Taro_048765 [Colocasia esculenta]|uniref:Uncharacterized protein n=1 Tax=Colocasia esculenta TaxID=4460 RepID=A0A843X923_COLES|nr:hypothetical protein [Colocasia esculenta]
MLSSKPWNTNVCVREFHLSTNAPRASNPHHISFMFFARTTMKFKCHIPMKLRMSSVIAFTRFTSQEKARTWPWLGNAGISCMKAGFCKSAVWGVFSPGKSRSNHCLPLHWLDVCSGVPEFHTEFRGSRLWIVRSMRRPFLLSFTVSLLSGSQQEQGGDGDILSMSCASISERSCDLERDRNIVNVTVELSSFGRLKKEKLEPHLRPLREATAPT